MIRTTDGDWNILDLDFFHYSSRNFDNNVKDFN